MPQAAAAVAAFAGSSATAAFVTNVAINVAVAVGASLAARAVAGKNNANISQSGIQTAFTSAGGVSPESFIIGRYVTAGHYVCPPMSHTNGNTQNEYLTYVIELSDISGISLSRVILDDAYSEIGTTAGEYGYPLLGQRINGTDHAWVKFYDGTQTTADAMLVAKYNAHPERPWDGSFIGTGTAYAILTFKYNREVYNGFPKVRFELNGVPLYDPRFDNIVGGSGAQRWHDKTTWVPSSNPAVMIYNIYRGIEIFSGDVWGGSVAGGDLPLDNWFTAMNACDVQIAGRPMFQAGFEVNLSMEPVDVIDELSKSCLGQQSENGGVFRMRVGAPASPVFAITDDDICISESQDFDQFPSIQNISNAIFSEYPEPESLWLSRSAPAILNENWETEDGGRRLATSINFPAVSNVSQVAQLMRGYINDSRRFRTHKIVLPPEAFILEPLDTVSWTSARNGYVNKVFEVVTVVDDATTLNQVVSLRERDPDDYLWSSSDELPSPASSVGLSLPPPQIVAGWSASATSITDASGTSRRAAIRLSWTGSAASDAKFVRYEIRLRSSGAVFSSGVADREAGFAVISDGILPNAEYEVRGRYVLDRPTDWSAWLFVTTLNIGLSAADFGASGISGVFRDAGLVVPELVTSLPTSGNIVGRLAFSTADNKLYRYTADGWTPSVSRSDIEGDTAATFAAEFIKEGEILDWVDANGGSASLDIVTDTGASGGKSLKIGDNSGNDYAYLISKRRIVLDPSARYFGRVRLRKSAGTGTVYLGFAGYKADGVTLCNAAGENSLNGQYYVIAGNVSPSSSYTEYKGYAGVSAQFHADVRYISPIILANFNAQAGVVFVDNFIVEKVISADRIEGGTITGDKIVANTITGGLLATSGLITQTAQIGDALVTTLKINGRAVTVPAAATAINNYSGGINQTPQPLQDCASVSIVLPEPQPIIVMWSFQMTSSGGSGWGHRVTHNGAEVYQRGAFGNNFMFQNIDVATSILLIDGVSGINTLRFFWRGLSGVNLERTSVFIMGVMR